MYTHLKVKAVTSKPFVIRNTISDPTCKNARTCVSIYSMILRKDINSITTRCICTAESKPRRRNHAFSSFADKL